MRPIGANDDLPAYWLDSLVHAREWLSGATLLKIMHHVGIIVFRIYAIINHVHVAAIIFIFNSIKR